MISNYFYRSTNKIIINLNKKLLSTVVVFTVIAISGFLPVLWQPIAAHADTVEWSRTNGGDGAYWSNGPGWSSGKVPAAVDDVTIKWSEPINIGGPTYDLNASSIRSLTMGGSSLNGVLRFTSTGRALTVLGEVQLGGGILQTAIYVDQPNAVLESRGDIIISNVNNDTFNNSVYLAVSNGASLNVTNNASVIIAAVRPSTGSFNVTEAGSTATINDITIGQMGNGHMQVSTSGVVNSKKAHIGYNANSVGSVVVSLDGIWNSSDDIAIGYNGKATAEVSSGGQIKITQADKNIIIASQAGSSGELMIGGASDDTAQASGIIDGNIKFGSGAGSIGFNHTDLDYQFASVVSGDGTVVNYAGTTILSGQNTYIGETKVNGGGLYVNGNQSAATGKTSIAAGATLGGAGTVGGNVSIAAGGVLRSYMDNGTGHSLTIKGDLEAKNASLNYDFGSATGSSTNNALLVQVDGNVDVTGSTINIYADAPLAAGKYHLLSYKNTVTSATLALGNDYGGTLKLKVTDASDPNDPDMIEVLSSSGVELRFWDPSGHNDGKISGGTGTWQAGGTLNNWTEDDGQQNGPYTDSTFSIFEGVAGIVTVDNANGAINIKGAQFTTDGYILKEGELTLAAGDNPFRVGGVTGNSTITTTIATVLAGTGSLDKKDSGTLKLTGANTYSGGVTVSAGILNIVDDSNLGAATGAVKIADGNLQFGAAFNSARDITVAASTSTIDTQTNAITLSGVISGAGMLNKKGTGLLTLTGVNTYSGGMNIVSGGVSVASDANLGNGGTISIGNASLLVSANATLAHSISLSSASSIIDTQAHDVILSGNISNAGQLNKHGSGTLTLSGTNTQSGGVNIAEGTLLAANDDSLGGLEAALTIGEATFKALADLNTTRQVVLTAAGSSIDTATYDVEFDDVITGNGTLNKKGTGKLIIHGANTFEGGTIVTAGILNVEHDQNLGVSDGQVTLDGATLELAGDFSTARMINLGAGNGVIDADAHLGTFKGVISGVGALTTKGTGTTVLSGANDYSGNTTVDAGELQIDGDQSGATGTVHVAANASLGGKGIVGGSVNIAASGTLRSFVDDALNSHALTIKGDLTAKNATLEYDYAADALHNTIVVNVAGNIDLTGSKINIVAGAPMAAGVYHLVQYSGNNVGSDPILGNVPGAGFSLRIDTPNTIDLINTGDKQLRFWNPSGINHVEIGGGSGVWERSGNLNNWADVDNSMNGPYTDGSFAVFEGTAGTVTVDNTNGVVNVSGIQFVTDGYVVKDGVIHLAAGDNDIRVGDGTSAAVQTTATISSELAGDGRLQKTDAGTLILKGSNTYTGGTVINAGTLNISEDNNFGAANAAISINDAVLQYAAGFDTGRNISVISTRSTIDTQSFNSGLTGVIDGVGGLVKTGSGDLTLSGENSFAGRTIIQEGGLVLAGQGTLAASDGVTLNAGSLSLENIAGDTASLQDLAGSASSKILLGVKSLIITAGQNKEFAGEISGTGKLQISGGAVVLTGLNTYEGGTIIDDGAGLTVGSGGVTGNIVGPIDLNGTMDFNRSDSITLDNQFSGTGTLNLSNGDTTTISASSPDFKGTINLLSHELVVNQILGGHLNIGLETILSGTGTVGDVHNLGTIMPGSRNAMGTLTIAGDYVSDSGSLIIKTDLGDDSSSTDKLYVTGDTSGNTTVTIINQGGVGAQTKDGIRVVQVDGQSKGVFRLNGNYRTSQGAQAVIAGAYAYTLNQGAVDGTGGDWYLRSEAENTPNIYNPATPLYTSYGIALNRLNQTMITSMQERVGQRLDGRSAEQDISGNLLPKDAQQSKVIWGRIDMAHSRMRPLGGTTENHINQNVWNIAAGLDGKFYDDASGSLIGSFWVNYLIDNVRIDSNHGQGKLSTDGYGVGGALTWYDTTGWYVDVQSHLTWYNTDFESFATRTSPVSGEDSFGYGVSLEAGQDIQVNNRWSVTPQMQLIYSAINLGSFIDTYQAEVRQESPDSFLVRAGLSVNYQSDWKDDLGRVESFGLYGVANIYSELLSVSKTVNISSVDFSTGEVERNWAEVGAGGVYQWANSSYALFGSATIATAFNNAGDNYRLGGKIGLKAKW